MFYDIYADLCAKKGMSESKVAESIGLNRSAVVKWKKGAVPSGNTIQKLAEFLEVPVGYLLGQETEKAPTPQDERPITFDDFTYAMHNETKNLSQEKKDMLLQMARFFNEELEKEKGKT